MDCHEFKQLDNCDLISVNNSTFTIDTLCLNETKKLPPINLENLSTLIIEEGSFQYISSILIKENSFITIQGTLNISNNKLLQLGSNVVLSINGSIILNSIFFNMNNQNIILNEGGHFIINHSNVSFFNTKITSITNGFFNIQEHCSLTFLDTSISILQINILSSSIINLTKSSLNSISLTLFNESSLQIYQSTFITSKITLKDYSQIILEESKFQIIFLHLFDYSTFSSDIYSIISQIQELNLSGKSILKINNGILSDIELILLFGESQLIVNDCDFNAKIIQLYDKSQIIFSGISQLNNNFPSTTIHFFLFNSSKIQLQNNTSGYIGSIQQFNTSLFYISDNVVISSLYDDPFTIDMYGNSMFLFYGLSHLSLTNLTLHNYSSMYFYDNYFFEVKQINTYDYSNIILFDDGMLIPHILVLTNHSTIILNGECWIIAHSILLKDSSSFFQNFKSYVLSTSFINIIGSSSWYLQEDSFFSCEQFSMTNTTYLHFNTSKKLQIQGNFDCKEECYSISLKDFCIINITRTVEETVIFEKIEKEVYLGNDIIILNEYEECTNLIFDEYKGFQNNKNPYVVLLSNGKILRYCPNKINIKMKCIMNGTEWMNEYDIKYLISKNLKYSFTQKYCPCSGNNCYISSLNDKININNGDINVNFIDKKVNLIMNSNLYQQTIHGFIGTVTFPNKITIYPLCEVIGKNGFVSINRNLFKYEIDCSSDDNSNELTRKQEFQSLIFKMNDQTIEIKSKYGIILYYKDNFNILKNYNIQGSIPIIIKTYNGMIYQNTNEICDFGIYENNNFNCLRKKIIQCDSGYYYDSNKCKKCTIDNCKYCTSSNCLLCNDNYQLKDNKCIFINSSICLRFINNHCSYCSFGGVINGQCSKCEIEHCVDCYEGKCYRCEDSFDGILENNQCIKKEHIEYKSTTSVISCSNTHFLNKNICENCNSISSKIEICENNRILKCRDDLLMNENGSCISIVNGIVEKNGIIKCNDGFSLVQGICVNTQENCEEMVNGKCLECKYSYGKYISTTQTINCNNKVNHCQVQSKFGCQRCDNGYFLEKGICSICDEKCLTCINDSKNCLSCKEGYFIDNYQCRDNIEMKESCKLYTATGKCVKCHDKYYIYEFGCFPCKEECEKCTNDQNCIECNSTMYMNQNNQCKFRNEIQGCKNNITSKGCDKCEDGYYLIFNECFKCSTHCKKCKNIENCQICENNYILNSLTLNCISINLVSHCIKTEDSKCSHCSFGYKLNENKEGCIYHVIWWIVLLEIIIALFILIIIISIVCVITKIFIYNVLLKQKSIIMNIKKLKIKMIVHATSDIMISTESIQFNTLNNLLNVDTINNTSFYIGNISNSTKEIIINCPFINDYKYQVKTYPECINLKPNKCCHVKISILPYCTCFINDSISLYEVNNLNKKKLIYKLPIKVQTELSPKLDIADVIEQKIIGEGRFGIISKGNYKGNIVAIKRLKEFSFNTETLLNTNFKKEVEMLYKIRCDYIVHFYGAFCFDFNKSIIMEYAPYGSLRNLIIKKNSNIQFHKYSKIKFIIDAAKGIQYLHNNGILHRDIKPENILIMSLDTINVSVCAKLTDFGSARNINMLQTNMTFTTGVGTPVFMAPEILLLQKYKKPADIYAFAITIYEVMKWGPAYDNSDGLFEYPWQIAEFVVSGKRLTKPKTMEDNIFLIISKCWDNDPQKRLDISTLIELLTNV
ncbi:protein serine/threonine kinase, putative [Entamoeba dispar SAW760]|uniref:Protein serine/threonine kinase, putative n=1 Tax=Entamoeba dispar (strain ATCC PRA-260 / SAW760) TaxID=370354 RepID=B0ENA6_ENTDS|nr:protein serine/threonine kinase, putative [Entamoeba dispar SAW760]EDR23983.1 protein serine/threonine kinase, putative [Entamoeba dispar SAW760]|eukprot:EDR23983.1 protein serine/threonine kinase, putative [Entamoeba dispar SAW760]